MSDSVGVSRLEEVARARHGPVTDLERLSGVLRLGIEPALGRLIRQDGSGIGLIRIRSMSRRRSTRLLGGRRRFDARLGLRELALLALACAPRGGLLLGLGRSAPARRGGGVEVALPDGRRALAGPALAKAGGPLLFEAVGDPALAARDPVDLARAKEALGLEQPLKAGDTVCEREQVARGRAPGRGWDVLLDLAADGRVAPLAAGRAREDAVAADLAPPALGARLDCPLGRLCVRSRRLSAVAAAGMARPMRGRGRARARGRIVATVAVAAAAN